MIERIKKNAVIFFSFAVVVLFASTIFTLLLLTSYNIFSQLRHTSYRIQQHVDRDPLGDGLFSVKTDIYLEYRNNSIGINGFRIDSNVQSDDILLVLGRQKRDGEKIIDEIEDGDWNKGGKELR